MKTHTKKGYASRDGGVLLMVLLVLLFVGVLQIGLLKLQETDAVESVFVEHRKQAFWLAESGLNDGLVLLQYDKNFRENPTAIPVVTVSAVGGSYGLGVEKTTKDALLEEYRYTITSTGTVAGVQRILQKTIDSLPGGKYAIIGISGNTELAANVTVIGPIAQIDGTLEINDSRNLEDGYVIMGDGEGALTDKKDAAVVANYPPPPKPVIDFVDYIAAIDKLAANTNYPHTGTINVNDSSLSGNLYYNADDVVIGGTGTTIADGTTIVTTGNISFPKSHVVIGNNVTILANNFSIANQSDIGGGTLIFSKNDIYLRNASDTTTTGGDAIALMALGDIDLESNIEFRGIMFAQNEVHLNANGTIEGTIIGGVNIDVNANMTISYDPTVFKPGTPVTPKSFGDTILTQVSWRELPAM